MNIKKPSLYYFLIVLISIINLLVHYPYLYGTDAFEIMWMANAFKNGALFSENSWLIHPTSYFGYYTFSHRPIGIPLFLAFLISLVNVFSFGFFSITEAILIFDILLIILIYKSARNLGKEIFKEEWSRLIFVTSILLSPHIIFYYTMTVSTRLIITIIMVLLINLNLKILNGTINKYKAISLMLLLLLIGALTHKLWLATTITIVFMIFTVFIQKSKKLLSLILIFIFPLCILFFFLGNAFFELLPRYELENPNIIELIWFFIKFYGFWIGIISIFFPVGIILDLRMMTLKLKTLNKNDNNLEDKEFLTKNLYLIFFFVPFSFLLVNTHYTIALFLPIILIFSVKGLIYIKKIISNFSYKLELVFPFIILISILLYFLLFLEIKSILIINKLITIFLTLSIISIALIIVFIRSSYKSRGLLNVKIDLIELKKKIWIIGLITSILISSILIVEEKRDKNVIEVTPWEYRYLGKEEVEIIKFFQGEDIQGLIFTFEQNLAERLAGVGFLPVFSDSTPIGIPIYYDFIEPNEIREVTRLDLSRLIKLDFFQHKYLNPIGKVRNRIIKLNMTSIKMRLILRLNYNVNYIISINGINNTYKSNQWVLIKSLYQSELEPIFSTKHLLIWKLF